MAKVLLVDANTHGGAVASPTVQSFHRLLHATVQADCFVPTTWLALLA